MLHRLVRRRAARRPAAPLLSRPFGPALRLENPIQPDAQSAVRSRKPTYQVKMPSLSAHSFAASGVDWPLLSMFATGAPHSRHYRQTTWHFAEILDYVVS